MCRYIKVFIDFHRCIDDCDKENSPKRTNECSIVIVDGILPMKTVKRSILFRSIKGSNQTNESTGQSLSARKLNQ